MEDGNIHNLIEQNNKTSDVSEKKNSNSKDKYISANGGSDLYKKSESDKKFHSAFQDICSDFGVFPYKPQEFFPIKSKFKGSATESNSQIVKPIPRPIITKQVKSIVKRPYVEKLTKVCKENGDHTSHLNAQISEKEEPIDEDALQKAIIKLHSSNNRSERKSHQVCKKRKVDESCNNAQFLVLQPAVKFKCVKCSSTFPSLVMLKQHQRTCAPPQLSPCVSPVDSASNSPNPSGDTNLRFTRSVYLCSACGTYYENWNLFLHIREVHNRHTCLFCFGMFSQAQKLASHLVVKHNIQEDYFTSKEDLSSKFSESFYLLCCKCENVFTERDDFVLHECTQVVKQCSVCKLKGSHSPQCPKNSKHKRINTCLNLDSKKNKKVSPFKPTSVSPRPICTDSDNGKDNQVINNKDTPISDTNSDIKPPVEDSGDSGVVIHPNANPLDDIDSKCAEVRSHSPMDVLEAPSSDVTNNNLVNSSYESDKGEDHGSPLSPVTGDSVDTNGIVGVMPETTDEQKEESSHNRSTLIDDGGKDNCNNTVENNEPPVDNTVEPPQETPPQTLYQIHPCVSWPRKYVPSLPTKPPPRNRRPPKRYQTSDISEEAPVQSYLPQPVYTPPPPSIVVHRQQEKPSAIISEAQEPVNRVPKLTVKIPKNILNKESTSDYSSESEDSDTLTVDVNAANGNNLAYEETMENEIKNHLENSEQEFADDERNETSDNIHNNSTSDPDMVIAGEDIPITELTLDHPLDRYSMKELLLVFLHATRFICIYCNHARKIAVNGKQLALHFAAQHRFAATVDSITAEELLPSTIVEKILSSVEDVQDIYLNMEGYETNNSNGMKYYDQTLECFQCFYVTKLQKDLYSHNRKMHQKTILLCVMCKSNFYSYSELLCHLCPGTYSQDSDIMFHCCLCPKDSIPSAFRLMVHLRKSHFTCDVCLEYCQNQSRLSNHVWKHKLHHLCYRCGIAYRNKPDITKHLFWKHGTESILCKKCLQKRWPHVYHFCIPPNTFLCEECNLTFSRAVSLKVHKRFHSNDFPYSCPDERCQEKFVSKKLLKKHEIKHLEPREHLIDPPKPIPPVDDKNDIIVIDDKPDDVLDSPKEKQDNKPSSKPKKSKKSKKNKDNKNNLLIDVNLPVLNLSESDSSDESDAEPAKKLENEVPETDSTLPPAEPMIIDNVRPDVAEEVKPEATVADVWDNFKMYQAQIEKETINLQPPKPKHVCDSDHDYCVVPMSDYEQMEEHHRLNVDSLTPSKDIKRKLKARKRATSKKQDGSSSSDSSSDSDSSCSCGSNCSCSSSSGSSSSSSSSDSDSESLSSPSRRQSTPMKPHNKDSDTSAVDVLMPLAEPVELPIAESDLDTDETDTDEDFYDKDPQRLANKVLAEKRNKLLLLATVAPSVNNGAYIDSSRPVTPEIVPEVIPEIKKKGKSKKKKKTKKAPQLVPPLKIPLRLDEPTQPFMPNKIRISLQTNTVIDNSGIDSSKKYTPTTLTDRDNKRASKRRRVPNKFYGYSSDEEYSQKQQMPPKLEWRKEDLPSSSGVQQQQPPVIPEYPSISDIMAQETRSAISAKLTVPTKEPIYSSSDEDSDSSGEGALQINHPIAEREEPVVNRMNQHRLPYAYGMGIPFPRPAGAREAKEGESVYCYCRCPYDEVSEMIACDAQGCAIEWFHFECVGIMVPPKGKWFCPDCRQKDEYYYQM